ncbi:hypothetical protein F5883DRAFT_240452 [Diaporthe sp. PMI_573]|nr:hypothetical protein F5883DRAFT_240452 [Diaporthaceae sp. PMI_573]
MSSEAGETKGILNVFRTTKLPIEPAIPTSSRTPGGPTSQALPMPPATPHTPSAPGTPRTPRNHPTDFYVRSIHGSAHKDGPFDYMAHHNSCLRYAGRTDSLNSFSYVSDLSPTAVDGHSEVQHTGAYNHLRYCNVDETLYLAAQDNFLYGECSAQGPATPVPFLPTFGTFHATSNPVWDYWWRFYKIGSVL